MRLLPRFIMPVLLLLFGGMPALAQNGAWTVSEAKGTVTVIDARGQRSAKAGTELLSGATVRTAARSSAVLVRGREFVTLRQNAQLRIPEAARERGLVQIIQDYGSALFNIGKQPNPHFGVETPYLAAVVKGTTFVIAVSSDAASLQVTEGAVEASTNDGGVRELIRPGAVAMIAAGDPLRMVIEGEGARVVDSPARAQGGPAAAGAPGSSFEAASEPATPQSQQQARIDEAIVSTPRDLGKVSNGFVGGEVAVLAAAVVADNTGRGNAAAVGSSGGRGEGNAVCAGGSCSGQGGNGNNNGGGAGNDNGTPGNGNGNGAPGGGGNGGGNDGAGSPGNGGNGGGRGNGNGGGPRPRGSDTVVPRADLTSTPASAR